MALTKEEKRQRAKDSRDRLREVRQLFPGAYWRNNGVYIHILSGSPDEFTVATKTGEKWSQYSMDTREENMLDMLEVITALTFRYNALVRAMNAKAARVQVARLEPIESVNGS